MSSCGKQNDLLREEVEAKATRNRGSGPLGDKVAPRLVHATRATYGIYLHAIAGELAKADLGDTGMFACDLLPRLPLVVKRINSSC